MAVPALLSDTDTDHPMETVLMGHPENVMPFCIRNYKLLDHDGNMLFEKSGNYQTLNKITFTTPIQARSLRLEVEHPSQEIPAAVFEILVY